MRDIFGIGEIGSVGSIVDQSSDFSVYGIQSRLMRVLWTPADITTALWLDASDAATITLISGKVSQWADKSGGAKHATQATTGLQPALTVAGLNGLDVVTVDGSDDAMDIPAITASAGVELFFVAKQNKTGSERNGPLVYMTAFTTYQPHWGGGPLSVALQDWYETFFTTNQYLVSSDNIPPGTYFGSLRHTGTQIIGNIMGVDVGTVTAQFSGVASTVKIGGGSANVAMNGYGELILVQSPSSDLRQIIQGYLAHKWGLSANLPSDHPYKSSAPTI